MNKKHEVKREHKDDLKEIKLKIRKKHDEEVVPVVPEEEVEEAIIPTIVPEMAPEIEVARAEVAVRHSPAQSEFSETVVSINRITKVTKGGKKLSFSALVVVGDAKGKVGYSLEKASEVSIAIRKAMAVAKRNMIKIPMKGLSIPHEIIGQCGGSSVLLKPAGEGTGVIAAGPVRAICEGAGIRNILTKCHRSNNPINVVKATMDGLSRLKVVAETVVSQAKEEVQNATA